MTENNEIIEILEDDDDVVEAAKELGLDMVSEEEKAPEPLADDYDEDIAEEIDVFEVEEVDLNQIPIPQTLEIEEDEPLSVSFDDDNDFV